MQMCQPHWGDLKRAIDERELSHLIAKDNVAATESAVRQLNGEDTNADFDPLMNANWAISGQYLKDVGLIGMVGNRCPLCEVEKSCAGLAEDWINGACDDQLFAARELGLVPTVQ